MPLDSMVQLRHSGLVPHRLKRTVTQTDTTRERTTIRTSITVPVELWKRVRTLAIAREIAVDAIVVPALTEWLARHERAA